MGKKDWIFSFLFGFIDGLLTSLTLCTGKFLEGGGNLTFGLAIRVATATLISGCFVFFVAKYGELRGSLTHSERELNFSVSGRLATTILGKKVLYGAGVEALTAGMSGFLGAFFPLIVALIDPWRPWTTLTSSLMSLGIFGFYLGKKVGKTPLLWSLSLILGGGVIICMGIFLHIVD